MKPRFLSYRSGLASIARRSLTAAVVATISAGGVAAAATPDLDAGKAKAVVCQACHGADGNAGADPQYPRLAGQYHDYLEQALHAYRTGARKNAIMAGFAATLTDEDISNVAAYFSSLPGGKLTDLHGHIQGD